MKLNYNFAIEKKAPVYSRFYVSDKYSGEI